MSLPYIFENYELINASPDCRPRNCDSCHLEEAIYKIHPGSYKSICYLCFKRGHKFCIVCGNIHRESDKLCSLCRNKINKIKKG